MAPGRALSDDRGFGADVVPFSEVVTGHMRPILFTLLGGAALLLLIACVNASSLLVVRSESRKREFTVRGALGASTARIVCQFVSEGLVLAALACVLGIAAASVALRLLVTLITAGVMEGMPYLRDLGLNPRALAFAALVSLLAALLLAVTRAWRLPKAELRTSLAEGGRSSSGTLWRRMGSKLVVVELATAAILLVGAGLLGKSLYLLLHVETGLQPDHLATLQVTMPNSYDSNEQVFALERQLVARIGNMPGVESAGISTSLPLQSWSMAANIVVAGRPWNGEHNAVPLRNVSSRYLRTLGATLLRGRSFTEAEEDPANPGIRDSLPD